MKTKAICSLLIAMFAGLALAGWKRTYGGSDYDAGRSVAQTSDGGYIVAGKTRSFGAGEDDVYLVKTDSVGDTIWMRTCGGSDRDYGRSVAQTSDGGYIVAGYRYFFGTDSYDAYLVKTDSLGISLAINETAAQKPVAIALSAYPNPFNSAVTITIDCHSRANGNPEIEIFDIEGRMVDNLSVGAYRIRPKNASTRLTPTGGQYIWQPDAALGSGVYLVRATVGANIVSKRVVYLK